MICFTNPGLIDLRAIRTFGFNAKENDNPVGYFGTGAKYALAVLLRTGHSVTLYRGLERYDFETKQIDARGGKTFDLVYMIGAGETVEMPFTLELGKNWELWQAYRELYSNALDEGGVIESAHGFCPEEDCTMFIVEGEAIEKVHSERELIFLTGAASVATNEIEAYARGGSYAYYRGIRVLDLGKPSVYAYNLKVQTTLTEDRTLKSQFDLDYQVCKLIAQSTDAEFIAKTIATKDTYEHNLGCYSFDPSDVFLSTFADLRANGRLLDLSHFATNLFHSCKRVKPPQPVLDMTVMQEIKLKKAVAFCKRAGWEVDSYPIVHIPDARGGLLGMAEDGKIMITTDCFERGVKTLVETLLEEYTHLETGHRDMTRDMQNHLFRTIVSQQETILEDAL